MTESRIEYQLLNNFLLNESGNCGVVESRGGSVREGLELILLMVIITSEGRGSKQILEDKHSGG